MVSSLGHALRTFVRFQPSPLSLAAVAWPTVAFSTRRSSGARGTTTSFPGFTPRNHLDAMYRPSPFDYDDRDLDPSDKHWQWQSFVTKRVHDFYKASRLERNEGNILEIGGGAVVAYMISAVPFAKRIFFAEFGEANREEVRKWDAGEAGAFDWEPFFDHVVVSLEGKSYEESRIRVKELREKLVDDMLFCNIHSSLPLEDERYENFFHVVSSHFCVEAACSDLKQYENAFKNIGRLVKKNGWILVSGALEQTYYVIEGKKFPAITIENEQVVKDVLQRSGFHSIDIDSIDLNIDKEHADIKKIYSVYAQLK
ncbi:nicotinamide N-methyltransferase-like isoform X2 [Oscarella lobularis]|uniref:nicotinamide N-methyltransferase-like isoform X2 n=1 Tax=Oscarella lobularis TaxID=121494 RepID=UPI003314453D